MYTPPKTACALREFLVREFGRNADVTFAQVSPDNEFGDELSIQVRTELQFISRQWAHNRSIDTAQNVRCFQGPLEEILATGADLIVLNYTGRPAARALTELREQNTDVDVVIPVLDRVTMRNAGDALAGVYGTTLWHPSLDDTFTQTFVDSWSDIETNKPEPSDIAYLAYVQLCQYTAAAERAGSLAPDAVARELDGHSYSFGTRTHRIQTCSDIPSRQIPVVTGLGGDQQTGSQYLQPKGLVETS